MGSLIGRRQQMRQAMGILRHTSEAVSQFGTASGVVLTGIGGIGKTALAGRIMSRLADDGWLVVVHEGRWNPTALINDVIRVLSGATTGIGDPNAVQSLTSLVAPLSDPAIADGFKINIIAELLSSERLLLVFDDFEQNLAPGADEFLDSSIDEVIAVLADAAVAGSLLVTCRYPLPGDDRFLITIPLPPLSAVELRRLLLRLPALRDLDAEDRRLIARTIGGHPRLIEFTDALLRGGRANFRHVQTRLRDLARSQQVEMAKGQSLEAVLNQAVVLGSADILLTELLALLTPAQITVLRQVAVSRAPMSLDDLAFALTPIDSNGRAANDGPVPAQLRQDVGRLASLTLLSAGEDIVMHPWTAELVTRNADVDLTREHEQALVMRLRRFEQSRGRYEDLIEIPRHLAALGRYDDLAEIAQQGSQLLPGTLVTIAYLDEILPLIPPTERAWALVAELEATALLDAGDLPAAGRRLNTMHGQIQARAAADPANAEWQRDLLISHNKLGDVAVAAGDLAAARTGYQSSLDIAQRLASANPGSRERQRDLSISLNKLGDVAVAAGDLAAAHTAYQRALDIRQRMAAAEPNSQVQQRDLAISHGKLGDLAVWSGDLVMARMSFQAALEIGLRLAAADPANSEWQRDLFVSHSRLGDVAVVTGELSAARTYYRAGLEIAERLADTDPANTEWQRDLSVSYNKLGSAALARNDLDSGRAAFQASLDIRLRLAAADPANTQWQRDLSVSYSRLGDVAIAAGDLLAARIAYQSSLDIAERLAAADPANAEWRRDADSAEKKLRQVADTQGRAETKVSAPQRQEVDSRDSYDMAEDQQLESGQPTPDRVVLPNIAGPANSDEVTGSAEDPISRG